MAPRNATATLPIRFFKIILQTNLQTLKIPNKFTRRYGVSLPNPVLINTPDGTKWKIYWKKINGQIWFEKGWKSFTQNYSLGHGCLVVFEYEERTSKFNVLILGQNEVEIDYDSSSDTDDDESVQLLDEKDNVDHTDDESVEILDERLNRKKSKQRSPLVSPRPHKKVRGEIKKTKSQRTTSSMNWPRGAKAQEVAKNFNSSNPFFTILINPINLVQNRLYLPSLKGVIDNKEKNVKLQIGKRSWNVKLLRSYETTTNSRRLTVGWSLFASESGLKPGDVCVFELINKNDLVFKVHVF